MLPVPVTLQSMPGRKVKAAIEAKPLAICRLVLALGRLAGAGQLPLCRNLEHLLDEL